MTGMDSPTVAIVPLKALSRAKTRLALPPSSRRALARVMALRVIDACAEAAGVDAVLLVAGDADAAEVGRERGVEVLRPAAAGLQVALDAADDAPMVRSAARSLVIAADLPLVRGGDLDGLLAAAPAPGVVVAPTRDGGTGALLRSPPDAIPTAYGAGSAVRHLRLAAAAGVAARRVEAAGLALDVDSLDDLEAAGRSDPGLAQWHASVAGGRLPA